MPPAEAFSRRLNSAASAVTETPSILIVLAFTSPADPYTTALLFTIVPADDPSTRLSSSADDVMLDPAI